MGERLLKSLISMALLSPLGRGSIICLGILLLLSSVALAEDEFTCREKFPAAERSKLLSDIEKGYESIVSLRAEFVQRSFFLGLNQNVVSRGKVAFKRPGMMDWLYVAPESQRFVADGETLWFSQPSLNQVTVGTFSKSFTSDLPVSFLIGIGSLTKDFKVDDVCVSDAGLVLRLVPERPDANLEQFVLLVDSSSRTPTGARVVDAGGNDTTIVFTGVEKNPELKEEQFKFIIPKGVDVIDRRIKDQLPPVSQKQEIKESKIIENTEKP